MDTFRSVANDLKSYLDSAARVRLSALPTPYRRAACLGTFALTTAFILFLRPTNWESALRSEVVYEGQAVDRLVWICLFIALGCAAASFTAGAYGASIRVALPGVILVVLCALAMLNFSTRPGRALIAPSAADVPDAVRWGGVLIAAVGIAGRLTSLGGLVLLSARSMRRRPSVGLWMGVSLGMAVAAPALVYLITLTLDTPTFPTSGDLSGAPSLFLRTESIALPMALFVASSYIVATLAAVQTQEGVHAFQNVSGHFILAVSHRLRRLRIVAVLLCTYWAAYILEILPRSLGRIDSFAVDQRGGWVASAMMLIVLVGLGCMSARDERGPSRMALLLLVVVFALGGLLEFLVNIMSAASDTIPGITGTKPLVFDLATVNVVAVLLAVLGALGSLLRGRRSDAALLFASAAISVPGLIRRIASEAPVPTPIHLAVLISVATAVGALLFPSSLTSGMRRWVSAVLGAILVLLVIVPAVAGVIDGRLFGVGLVAAYAYRFLVRGNDLNDRAAIDPGVVPRALGGHAAVALTGWAVVAFTERFSQGGEAAALWTRYGSLALAGIAVPMVVVFAAQRARQAQG